jgi:hypothetical protein
MKLELPLTELVEIMKACSGFVSKYSDDILSFIQLKCANGACLAIASDRHKVRVTTVYYINGDNGIYYIPVLRVPKPKPFNDTAIIETDEKTTTVTMSNISSVNKIPGGYFVDIEKHLSLKEPVYECVFAVGNLLDSLKGFNRKDQVHLIAYGALKPHVLKKRGTDGDYALVVPCSMSKREETDDA